MARNSGARELSLGHRRWGTTDASDPEQVLHVEGLLLRPSLLHHLACQVHFPLLPVLGLGPSDVGVVLASRPQHQE